jgi:Pyruvate/2-oxoacid:ferredoxin oxidoreductase gamma subunit
METTNILLAGVGGQGVLLASQIFTQVAIEADLDVKQSEVHGMSQRGGSVTSHVRFGTKVPSYNQSQHHTVGEQLAADHYPLNSVREQDPFIQYKSTTF